VVCLRWFHRPDIVPPITNIHHLSKGISGIQTSRAAQLANAELLPPMLPHSDWATARVRKFIASWIGPPSAWCRLQKQAPIAISMSLPSPCCTSWELRFLSKTSLLIGHAAWQGYGGTAGAGMLFCELASSPVFRLEAGLGLPEA